MQHSFWDNYVALELNTEGFLTYQILDFEQYIAYHKLTPNYQLYRVEFDNVFYHVITTSEALRGLEYEAIESLVIFVYSVHNIMSGASL